jgi:predicted DNA-binding protein with PD1-like motif
MRSHEATTGRTIVVAFEHGEDFFAALEQACRAHGIRQGYLPVFVAGLSTAELVGTCERLDDPVAPVRSTAHLTNVEALGGGVLAYDEATGTIAPHVHITAGLKAYGATAHTSHLVAATVQLLTELVIVELTGPVLRRARQADLYDVPLLHFDPPASGQG